MSDIMKQMETDPYTFCMAVLRQMGDIEQSNRTHYARYLLARSTQEGYDVRRVVEDEMHLDWEAFKAASAEVIRERVRDLTEASD